MTRIRITLPAHLRTLAGITGDVHLEVVDPPTVTSTLDALEFRYPMLKGTIRHHGKPDRRAFMRFFACGQDLSHDSPEAPLPAPVCAGEEPLQVIGAIAGG